jgi:hypothetical protein
VPYITNSTRGILIIELPGFRLDLAGDAIKRSENIFFAPPLMSPCLKLYFFVTRHCYVCMYIIYILCSIFRRFSRKYFGPKHVVEI